MPCPARSLIKRALVLEYVSIVWIILEAQSPLELQPEVLPWLGSASAA